ncbi:MAG: NAD-dependent epimerase/dehydratase family protein, partial [Anaerovibrio sp.]|uniref:NAD-dependent epimerase/dehydratase family protein n=1 Tax=Anaerovibrio sp. TaxID=1872532 RepID=UPI002629834E
MSNNKNNFRRSVLFAGNSGFMKESLKEKLEKEGWDVVGAGEDSFKLYNPQIVVYFAGRDCGQDMLQVLYAARQYHAGRFLYVTSAGTRQEYSEEFVLAWSREHGVQSSVVILPEVFGKGMSSDDSVIARFFCAACEQEKFQLHGRDDVPVPVLYSEDAAHAILMIIQQELKKERIAVSSEEAMSFMQVVLTVNGFVNLPQVEIMGQGEEFSRTAAENAANGNGDCYELKLKPKYRAAEMLKPVYELYATHGGAGAADTGSQAGTADGDDREPEQASEKENSRLEKYKPYLENIGLFVVIVILSLLQGKTPVNSATGLDIAYIYIIIMGILYGKKQSLPAVLPSMALLTWGLLNQHGELASIFYVPENMFHYSTYLFLGVFTGYISDSWRGQVNSLGYKLNHFARRYSFLQENYQKSIEIKDKLYHQIINSDDSIGWLYGIIRQLDTVEVEDIFTQAAAVTGRIMGTQNVAIYVMGKDQFYLRQKVRLGDRTAQLPHSRRTEDNPYIMDMLANHHLFVNHGLQLGLPDLAAPIIYDGRLIAVIEIYGMNFEQWSIYQQNLLSVTARLISMAMGKAYLYEEGIQSRRFVPQTRILQPEEFAKLEKGLRTRAALQENVRNMLLELSCAGMSYQEL